MSDIPVPDVRVLGLGAMGTLAAYRLRRAGFSVSALHRHHSAPVLRRRLVTGAEDHVNTLEIPVLNEAPPASIRFLLLATKAADTRAALRDWLPALAPDCEMVCLQNGIHTLADTALPAAARLTRWITTDAAWKQGETVHWVADNRSCLGDGNALAPPWFVALSAVWPGLHWEADIEWYQWRKLAVNAVINPLTAHYRCRNGELIGQANGRAHMRQLAGEVDRIARWKFPAWPMDTLARSIQVCEQTAANRSSMLVDVLAGRETEIAFINGALIAEAQKAGMDLPAHRALVATLLALSATVDSGVPGQ